MAFNLDKVLMCHIEKKSVCAVVISYQPTVEFIKNIHALAAQVDEIIIVDNCSSRSGRAIIEESAAGNNVTVIYNHENLGIGSALNTGIRFAKERGYEWIGTFDQDSRITSGFVKKMLNTYDLYSDKARVAILSPQYRDQNTGRMIAGGNSSEDSLFKTLFTTMTSGNFVKVNMFDLVGCFNEDLFIDYVDHEFCLRVGYAGYSILEVNGAILDHNLGDPTEHRVLNKIIIATNHAPHRRYYNSRNRVYLYKRYLLIFPAWVISDGWGLAKEIVKIFLFEQDRKRKAASIMKGIVDGLLGKMGKL
jgi:rhamnosyltransferase